MTVLHFSISATELAITANVSSPRRRNSSQYYGALTFCSSFGDAQPPPAIMINGDFPLWQIVWGFHGDYVRFRVRERSAAGQADGISWADLWWLCPWPCLFRIKFLKCKLYRINSSKRLAHGSCSVYLCRFSLISESICFFLFLSTLLHLEDTFKSKATLSIHFLGVPPEPMTLAWLTLCFTSRVTGTLSLARWLLLFTLRLLLTVVLLRSGMEFPQGAPRLFPVGRSACGLAVETRFR